MEIGKVWTSICRKYNIEQCTTEAHMPWQNAAERYIQEVKKMVNIIMDRTEDALIRFRSCAPCMWFIYLGPFYTLFFAKRISFFVRANRENEMFRSARCAYVKLQNEICFSSR